MQKTCSSSILRLVFLLAIFINMKIAKIDANFLAVFYKNIGWYNNFSYYNIVNNLTSIFFTFF